MPKAAYFLGNETFEIRTVNQPKPEGNQVLVRNMAVGVCGTDVHIYHGHKGSAAVHPPVVLGHEISGQVIAVGELVTAVKAGDRVAIDPNVYCGNCRPCKSGKKQNCEKLEAYGVTRDGGFAEFCIVPEVQCFLVGSLLSYEEAAMMEPLACAIHGIEQAGIQAGQTVLILGGGAIGLMMLQLAKLSGAARVLLSEPVAMRRKIGLDLGADAVLDPRSADLADEFYRLTGLYGADVVIECVGSAQTSRQAIDLAGAGAAVLLFGVPHPDATIDLPLYKIFEKELKIIGSFINPDTNQKAIDLLNQGLVNVNKLITHQYGLRDIEKAIHMQMDRDSLKVLVLPQE